MNNQCKPSLTLLFLCFFLWQSVRAQEGNKLKKITLEDCRQLVLTNNEATLIASAKIDFQKEAVEESKIQYLPKIDANATISGFTHNPVLTTFPRYSAIGDVSVEQPVYLGGKLKSLEKLATIQQKIAEQEKAVTDEELLLYVEQLYWRVVAVNQRIVVAENFVETLTQLEGKINNYLEAGIINRTDLLETQVAKNRAVYNLEIAKNTQYRTRLQLALAIGMEKPNFSVSNNFSAPVFSPQFDTDLQTAHSLRADLQLLDNAIFAKREEENLILSDYKPQVAFSGGVFLFAGEETEPRAVESSQIFGAGFLNVRVPIYDWKRKDFKLRKRALEEKQLLLEKQQAKEQIAVELQQALDQFEEAKINIALSEKSKDQAQENARITNNNYEEGIVTSEEVLEAEALYQEAQLSYITARVQEQLSYSHYLKTLGKLSEK